MINLTDLSFSYADSTLLSGINLNVQRGEAIALIGPNGSGKSTLLRILCGVLPATAGSYVFDGEAINPKSLKQASFAKRFHQRVGFLFQNSDSQLFCPLVFEEVAFGPRQMGLPESEVTRRVEDCLQLLGISKLANAVPYHLSEGEKRRLALACVLALNPDLLLLDEPMNGLDPRTRRFLHGFLAQLGSAGKTLVCATHDLDAGENLFRRAIVFSDDHRIIADGPYAEIVGDQAFLREHNIL